MLQGKTGVVLGVANKRSIAWGITQALSGAGARLCLTYQDRFEKSVNELAAELDGAITAPCDVTSDEEIKALFEKVDREFGRLDMVIHAVAFAPTDDLKGEFVDTSRDGYKLSQDISAYSLVAVTREARPLLARQGGSVVTMTYYGAEKVVPNYNVMGVSKAALEANVRYLAADLGPENIRVNAISAGPVNTLAARGVSGFTSMLKEHSGRTPLRRNVELREIGDTALFLCSPMSSGITGEVIYVDGGYHIMGM